ncbi:hypothetical protein BV898_04942 [Hypsibius exemplaris]|uniref:Pinin n=1 Tax=Hypsibius exemplaris TaxID=2072580 RepID=A0A1W0X1K6_HYPEX|nr:hypothetical protein BV898_04942 [Hypsibius exemplaris]
MEVDALTEQLQQAKEQLRETDESIKKVTGRDVFEGAPRIGAPYRDVPSIGGPLRGNGSALRPSAAIYTRENAAFARDVERSRPAAGYEESSKRSRAMSSFHPVIEPGDAKTDRHRGGWDDEDEYRRRKIQSLVIVDAAPKKTREERIVEAQVRVGDKDVARNRRIFGSLMGTLKKFQQEQTDRATTDERQSEIRRKLEEKEFAEKREAQRARRELFWDRKRRAAVVKFLETKVDIVKRFHEWEATQKPLLNFIRTESGPWPVYYMPNKLNKAQEEKLEKSRKVVEEAIRTRKEHLESQLRRLDGKIEYMNRPKQSGLEVDEDIKEMKKKMQEEPLDDIDVDALLDDNEVEGLELVAIEEHEKQQKEHQERMETGAESAPEGATATENGSMDVVEADVAVKSGEDGTVAAVKGENGGDAAMATDSEMAS